MTTCDGSLTIVNGFARLAAHGSRQASPASVTAAEVIPLAGGAG